MLIELLRNSVGKCYFIFLVKFIAYQAQICFLLIVILSPDARSSALKNQVMWNMKKMV